MPNNLLDREIREEEVLPCYFFHGEEVFLAQEFIHSLKNSLISPDVQNLNLERFTLEESAWRDIMDLARTVPFFFSPWRIIVVETAAKEDLSSSEEKNLQDYFSSPSPKTVLVIIFSGKITKGKSLFKLFSSLPPSLVYLKELKPLKGRDLFSWLDKKLSSQGKIATPEARDRLMEVIGNDLQRLDNEVEKLATYVGDKKVIDLDDVNQVSDWVKTFMEWELANSLEKVDLEQCLIILDKLFTEGVKPGNILGLVSNFFRNILLAKIWLREKNKDKKEIFRELKPQILERFGNFYATKFHEFFSLVERTSLKDLKWLIGELEQIDLRMKTSDASSQVLLESFFYSYCCLQEKEGFILKGRD